MQEIMEISKRVIMNTYGRFPLVITKGKGCKLWAKDGREYLDFVSGLAACNLGHSHPNVVEAIKKQSETLIHVSNLFYTEPQINLAELLVKHSFADKVFFCNSGAEANEAAIKLARKYSRDHFGEGRYGIISMNASFHGRTMATITATGQSKFHDGFEPLLEGFSYIPYNNLDALKKRISGSTCAILLEPIQGEGGVNVPSPDFLREVREICDKHKLLVIFDEVQTGFGRTGTLFAYETTGMVPDIMTVAKSMAGGVSMGAALATDKVASSFGPGTHASTFGGNPLASAAGVVAMETITREGFLADARSTGEYLHSKLLDMAKNKKGIKEVRGRGFMWGIELTHEGGSAVSYCFERGLIINCVKDNVLRMLPPIVVSKEEIDKAISILDGVLQ